jgi:hypothetical protein
MLALFSRGSARHGGSDGPSILDDLAGLPETASPDPFPRMADLYHAATVLDRPEGLTWQAVVTAGDALFGAFETWRAIDRGEAEDPDGTALGKAREQAEAAYEALGKAMQDHSLNKTSKTGAAA